MMCMFVVSVCEHTYMYVHVLISTYRVYLTSTVVENRARGTRLLSEVMTHLHTHQLPPDDGRCYLIVH